MTKEQYEIIAAIEEVSGIKYTGKTEADIKTFINKYQNFLWEFADFIVES